MNPRETNNLQLSHAQWVRADFHLHTRADKEFKYSGDENSFVADYVAALEKAGIRLREYAALGARCDDA